MAQLHNLLSSYGFLEVFYLFSKPFKENVTVSLQDEYRALKPLFGMVAGYGIFILAQTLGLVKKDK